MSETVMIDVLLHDVGEGLAEAEIVEWLVAPGQAVHEDQMIVVISTDKASVELPAPASGILHEQLVSVGTTVPVGTLLARIESSGGVAQSSTSDTRQSAISQVATGQPAGVSAQSSNVAANVAAAPSTRRLAQELGVDLSRLNGSGPNGRILDSDVRRAVEERDADTMPAAQRGPEHQDDERVPLSRTRLATARAVGAAWREVPHIVEFRQIDATTLERARRTCRAEAERSGLHLTFLPFFIKAVSAALAKHPNFNARLDMERGEVVYSRHCHVGIATASEAGLIVPVIRKADKLSLLELARTLDAVIDRGRRQVLSTEDLSAGTITITNFGSYGTWLGTPIIRAPEVALVGFGRIQPGVLPVDGAAVVRPVLPLCVAADHRVNDGIHLAAFLDTLAGALTDPAALSMPPSEDDAHA